MFNVERGYGFIKPDGGGSDCFFHISVTSQDDEIGTGKLVDYDVGTDEKSGRSKAVRVDLV